MRHTLTTAVIASVLPAFAWAQTPPPADLTDEVPLAEDDISPKDDFSADKDLFEEVKTDPERVEAELAYQERLRQRVLPRHARMPGVALTVQAVAGVFSAGVVGLLGGAIGEAVDAGNSVDPLGGMNGPVVGLSVGSLVGASLGTWGAGAVFEKEADLGWYTAGAAVGTVLGGGVATGIFAIDEGDTATAVAVLSFLAIQTAGALLFAELGEPPLPPPPPPPQE